MTQDYIQLAFDRIIQTHVYTAIVLRNKEQRFAIFTEPSVGKFLQSHLSGEERSRPLSHDFLSTVLGALDVKVKQVLINDVQDTTFLSRIFLETEKNGLRHIVEIECTPLGLHYSCIRQQCSCFLHKRTYRKSYTFCGVTFPL